MRHQSLLFVGFAVAAIGATTLPSSADAAAQRSRAAAARPPALRGLDLTTRGPSVAMQAAQAAQTASLPGAAPARLPIAPSAEAPTSAPAGSVSGLTVRPETRSQGKIIASSDAAPMTSPDFSAADAAPRPLAIAIAPNTALGRQEVSNRPPATAGGVLGTNPELLGINPTRGQIGITTVY